MKRFTRDSRILQTNFRNLYDNEICPDSMDGAKTRQLGKSDMHLSTAELVMKNTRK